MQLSIEQHAAIIAWAEKTPEVEAVLLYGSRYTGTAKPTDDVDLALVMTTGFSGKQRADSYLDTSRPGKPNLRLLWASRCT